MNARRSFIKGAGLVGAFAIGAASYRQVKDYAESHQDISHLAPPKDANTLQIQGAYGEKPKVPENGLIFYTNREVTNKVDMTVGKDNRLWVKVNDEWKRVSIEG